MWRCKVKVTQWRKGEWGPCRFKGSISHRYGSFYLFFFPLLPSISTFFKFSPYNRALYTIKPSLTPPLQQLPVSDLETQVICHQRGELDETASPAWELHTGPGSSHCCSTESLNIVKQSSRETEMEKWCQCVSDCVSVLFSGCFYCGGLCVCLFGPVSVFSPDKAWAGTKRRWKRGGLEIVRCTNVA